MLVLLGAVLQIVAAGFLSVGTFETSVRLFQVYIQPAGWAFSIWGLIYTLSLLYGLYQFRSRVDSSLLQMTRLPAAIAFYGSIAWLFFAGFDTAVVWLTVPTLALMAGALAYVITLKAASSPRDTFFAKTILLPYAAWTGIAAWLNIQALVVERGLITSETINLSLNLFFFAAIAGYSWFWYQKTRYNLWYGGVLFWALAGIMAANSSAPGNPLFVWLALAYTGLLLYLTSSHHRRLFKSI